MNSSVALTTRGSALGKGSPVADVELANLTISAAGKRARDAMVWVEPGVAGTGEEAADGPRDDKSGVWGESAGVDKIFFACGVTGASSAGDDEEARAASPSSLSRTIFPSAIFALRISELKRHIARSRFGRLMIRSVISPCRDVSNLLTAAKMRSLSEVGATDPEGEELRGGVGARLSLNEMGVDGCSGADAVALREAGSSKRESCEAEGDGDLSDGELLEVLDFRPWTCSANFVGSWIPETTSLRERPTRDSTIELTSLVGTVSMALTRLLSSPVSTSFRTTGDSAASSS